MQQPISIIDLGFSEYQPTWDVQKLIQKRIIDEKLAARNNPDTSRSSDVLLFVEHPHVYTLGKSGDRANLLKSEDELAEVHASYVEIDRGGDITYHGPGQIVGYPILDLDRHFTDIHKYLRFLEEIIILVCAEYGIEAGRKEKLTGVWVGDEKICAMGVKCSRWVTLHGFAFNVNTKLHYFGNIVPCGIQDKGICSLQSLLGREIDEMEVKQKIIRHFCELFHLVRDTTDTWLSIVQDFPYFSARPEQLPTFFKA